MRVAGKSESFRKFPNTCYQQNSPVETQAANKQPAESESPTPCSSHLVCETANFLQSKKIKQKSASLLIVFMQGEEHEIAPKSKMEQDEELHQTQMMHERECYQNKMLTSSVL